MAVKNVEQNVNPALALHAGMVESSSRKSPSPVLNAMQAISKFHQVCEYTNPFNSSTLRDFVEVVKHRNERPPVQKEPLPASLLQELLVSLLTSMTT